MKTLKLLTLLSLATAAVGCADGDVYTTTCVVAPAWAQVVIWNSPASDCAAACGTFTTGQWPRGSGSIERLCVFTPDGELPLE